MGTAPLCMFVGSAGRDVFVATEHAIGAFGRDGAKILQTNFSDSRPPASPPASEDSGSSPGRRRTRLHSRPSEGAVSAECAAYISEDDEVAVAHSDGNVQVYSLRYGQMGELLRDTESIRALPSFLTIAAGAEFPGLLVGCTKGLLTLV